MRYNLVDKTTTGVVTAVTFRDDMPRLFIRMTRADGESAMEAMTVLFLELGEVQVMQQLEGYCAWMKTVAKRMCAEVTLIPLDEIVIPEHKMTQAELDALHSYG